MVVPVWLELHARRIVDRLPGNRATDGQEYNGLKQKQLTSAVLEQTNLEQTGRAESIYQAGEKYIKIKDESLFGVFTWLYAKKMEEPHLKNFATFINKLEVDGKTGNKGGVAIWFQHKHSTLAYSCCHLDSGHSNEFIQTRRKQLEKIIANSFVNERWTNMKMYEWKSHDIKLIFGDMNFRFI